MCKASAGVAFRMQQHRQHACQQQHECRPVQYNSFQGSSMGVCLSLEAVGWLGGRFRRYACVEVRAAVGAAQWLVCCLAVVYWHPSHTTAGSGGAPAPMVNQCKG